MLEMNLGGRLVGPNHPPLVIAEIGINHNGSLETAFQIVDAAASAGAEVIKHQTHVVKDEMSAAARKVIPGNSNKSIYNIIEECALDEEEEFELKRYVEAKGLIFLSTPFSRAAAERLKKMNVLAYKIGSGECNNYPLIKHIASFGKPIILSTGMNSIASVSKSVEILRSCKVSFALLHTTNLYPTPFNLVRLGAMTELQKAFPDAIVGLSDHTINNLACFGAVALGASVLERHFTDSMTRVGPDIICSMDPKACAELIEGSKILFMERGGLKEAAKEEQVTMDFAFATVVTTADIKAGDFFTEENLWVKRPGTGGLKADKYEETLGKKAARDLSADTHLCEADIAQSKNLES